MFGSEYGAYVFLAYASSALILGALIWSTIAASRRARRELDAVDRRGEKR